jgi:hypothetical protein
MRRLHLFEFTDQPWYPQVFRSIQTDYLQFVSTRGAGHQNLLPIFEKALAHSETQDILDLCSGGTGPWVRLSEYLRQAGLPVHVTLTDKFPLPGAVKKWAQTSHQAIEYLAEPVDAMQVPSHLKGMRTMFEGFHHFKPREARCILQDACEKRAAIGIFEASLPAPHGLIIFLLSPLLTLLGYLFSTPFITPRTWSRLLWTYLLPLVPLATCWDGWVSFLRVYSREELRELVNPLQGQDYRWEIGQASTGTPLFVFTYLLGYPVQPGS